MKIFMKNLRAYVVLSLLLGAAYPLVITLLAQALAPGRANGSLMSRGGSIVGSRLIGQNFIQPVYFYGRPSAINYDAAHSGGTNLGPSSGKLMDLAAERISRARRENGLGADTVIPADMALASASGLDPHISPENALLQSGRVARMRGLSVQEVRALVQQHTDSDFLGIWGRPGVNVATLNLALDERGAADEVKAEERANRSPRIPAAGDFTARMKETGKE